MEKLKQEFGVVDIIILAIVVLVSIILEIFILPVALLYYISRKVDNKRFKVFVYVAMGFLLLSSGNWEHYNLFLEVIENNYEWLQDWQNTYFVTTLIQYGLPAIAYSLVLIGYTMYPDRNKYIVVAFLVIAIGFLVPLTGFFARFMFQDIFNVGQVPFRSFWILSLRPYLIALVLASLYKDLFIDDSVAEIYEETI